MACKKVALLSTESPYSLRLLRANTISWELYTFIRWELIDFFRNCQIVCAWELSEFQENPVVVSRLKKVSEGIQIVFSLHIHFQTRTLETVNLSQFSSVLRSV